MEIPVSRTTLSIFFVLVLVCSTNAMNYLAFPRMGRSNYLAFPRMGRSQVKTDTVSTNCCGMGLKSELVIGQDGKEEELRRFCSSDEGCCEGLSEVVHPRPSGLIYAFCMPDSPVQNSQTSEVFGALKSLMRRK